MLLFENWIRRLLTPIIEVVSGRVAFQYPNFRYFMMARFLATLSSEMQAIAVGWQVYGLTHRPLDLGLVGLAQFLPGVLLFLVSGQAADRFPRRLLAPSPQRRTAHRRAHRVPEHPALRQGAEWVGCR